MLTVDDFAVMASTLQLGAPFGDALLRLAAVVLCRRQVVERCVEALLVVVPDPASDEVAGPGKVAQVFLRQGFTAAAMETLDRSIRFRVVGVQVSAGGVRGRLQTLNNEVLPFLEEQGCRVETILSDNGREFCGRPDRHPYELFLQLEEIEHRTTAVNRPQSNGFIERFHRTLLDEHLRVMGRTKWYETLEKMQADLDAYLVIYNTKRPHRGRNMNGRTPYAVFKAGIAKTAKCATNSGGKEAKKQAA